MSDEPSRRTRPEEARTAGVRDSDRGSVVGKKRRTVRRRRKRGGREAREVEEEERGEKRNQEIVDDSSLSCCVESESQSGRHGGGPSSFGVSKSRGDSGGRDLFKFRAGGACYFFSFTPSTHSFIHNLVSSLLLLFSLPLFRSVIPDPRR